MANHFFWFISGLLYSGGITFICRISNLLGTGDWSQSLSFLGKFLVYIWDNWIINWGSTHFGSINQKFR